MASENETVENALEAISELVTNLYDKEIVEKCCIKDVWSIVQQAKNRIEAAHKREVESYKRLLMTSQCALEDEIVKNQNMKREVAELDKKHGDELHDLAVQCNGMELEVLELRECLNEAVFVMQTLFDKQMPKWRKALEGAKDEGK